MNSPHLFSAMGPITGRWRVAEGITEMAGNSRRAFRALLTAASRLLTLAGLAVFYAPMCFAIELAEGVQLHGFATQTAMTTSANSFCGDSEDRVSFACTEIGLNASWLATPRLQVAGQALYRRAGEGHEGELRLDYGLLDYAFVSEMSTVAGIRLGRFKLPLGFYNETRDVAFTRPSILLPQSIYFDRTRNLALSGDGINLYGEYRSEWGDFFLEVGGGWPQAGDRDTELAVLGRNWAGSIDPQPSIIGRLLFERDGGRLRLGVSSALVDMDYNPSLEFPQDLDSGSVRFTPLIFSAQYNAERWSLTGEYALRRLDYDGFGPIIPDQSFTGESYYLQAAYRFRPDWEVFLRYDALFTDRSDRDGKDFESRTTVPGYNRFAKDWTAGIRWDVSRSLMVRAEFHVVDGTAWLPLQDNPDPFANDQYWNLFALLASFRF